MIVTEEVLAPFRQKGGLVSISGATNSLSARLFTPTTDAFRLDWPASDQPNQLEDRRETLEIVLVLAFTRYVPVLKPGREWLALDHQCGGFLCEHQRMVATRLSPRPTCKSTLRLIAREGYGAEGGHFYRGSVLASRIASYVSALERIGLDCECSWPYLTESLYPIDATQENIDQIAEDAPNLDSLVTWDGFIRARYASDPAVFFMTENSD